MNQQEENFAKCGYCGIKKPVTLNYGEYYKNQWFCSTSCVQNYKEDEKLESIRK